MRKLIKKACLLLVFLVQAGGYFGNAFASLTSTQVDAGTNLTVNDSEMSVGSSLGHDDDGDFHYGYYFKSNASANDTTYVKFENEFTLTADGSCNTEHNTYGFRIGSSDTTPEKTSLNLTATTLNIDFKNLKGSNIYGFALTNNSHDNDNPLKNEIKIEDFNIKFEGGVNAKTYAAGIYFTGTKDAADTKGTSNTISGNTLNISITNEYKVPDGAGTTDKGYAIGIMSQGDILSSEIRYEKSINIKTEATNYKSASYGLYMPTANGATTKQDLHYLKVYAPEISIESRAEEDTSMGIPYSAGIFITGNRAKKDAGNLGKTVLDLGIDRTVDWNIMTIKNFGTVTGLAKKVSIYGTGNAIRAEFQNTWLAIGGESISLVSDEYETVSAQTGAKVLIYGNSYIEARTDDKIFKSALYASNADFVPGGTTLNPAYEDPESEIYLTGGNHIIRGDIVSLHGSYIGIDSGTHDIEGDIYAYGHLTNMADNSKLTAEVSIKNNGGKFTGKTDTYYAYHDDLVNRDNDEKDIPTFVFSPREFDPGIINLSFSNNADWNMTDRSFVTSLSLEKSTVHLNYGRNYADPNDKGRGLFIEKLDLSDGKSGFFNMTLNGTDKSKSDMLYIKSGENFSSADGSDYRVNIDIVNSNFDVLENGGKIRYATVKGEDLKNALEHKVVSYGNGVLNVSFETAVEEYDKSDSENEEYNGDENSTDKPGNELIDQEFGDGSYNLYITKVISGGSGSFSNSAKSVFELSRFGYLQIIQPDRLNKRVGDVFNLGNEEDGLWFRTSYDDLGVEGIRSDSVAMQGGYDKLYQHDDFSFRYGLSGRYTKSDISFEALGGNGEIQATQLSLYATYISENDWFLDVTGRYGYIANESRLTTESGFNFASSYDNWFQGVSVEAGKRFYLHDGEKHDFYFAPQALLTYLHINGVDYTTNQDSHIAIADINSVITRFGTKLGYVYDDTYQIALKWDWFREWNGQQHFSMQDKTTGAVPVVYDMGTDVSWYDVGLTLQANPKENLAVYFDAERLYGGFYQNSWRFSAGVRITF